MVRDAERRHLLLLVLLLLIGVFNVLDFAATQDLVVYGEHAEWNPFMRRIVGHHFFSSQVTGYSIGFAFPLASATTDEP